MSWVKEYEEKRKGYIEQGYSPYDSVCMAYQFLREERNKRLEKEKEEREKWVKKNG